MQFGDFRQKAFSNGQWLGQDAHLSVGPDYAQQERVLLGGRARAERLVFRRFHWLKRWLTFPN